MILLLFYNLSFLYNNHNCIQKQYLQFGHIHVFSINCMLLDLYELQNLFHSNHKKLYSYFEKTKWHLMYLLLNRHILSHYLKQIILDMEYVVFQIIFPFVHIFY